MGLFLSNQPAALMREAWISLNPGWPRRLRGAHQKGCRLKPDCEMFHTDHGERLPFKRSVVAGADMELCPRRYAGS